jgi:hypothetical protein
MVQLFSAVVVQLCLTKTTNLVFVSKTGKHRNRALLWRF